MAKSAGSTPSLEQSAISVLGREWRTGTPVSFYLPKLSIPPTGPWSYDEPDEILRLSSMNFFDIRTLATAIQHKCSIDAINEYLANFEIEDLKDLRDGTVDGWNIVFFAVERHCSKVLRLLLENGADPNCVSCSDLLLPAHVFAILLSKWTVLNCTEIVKTLLEFGADPTAIPKLCRQNLFDTFHLSLRYSFFRASLVKANKGRPAQMYEAYNIQEILRIPYRIIGQGPTTKLVSNQIFAHYSMCTKAPLVMAFAGPSGHGKTEFAKQMGRLLNIPSTIIDCSQVCVEWQLFGSSAGFSGQSQGSVLNNFLSSVSGQRAVVFLDEFDKTEQEVREALLTVTESGNYNDRRYNKPVDATKIIWILATNRGDKIVQDFYEKELAGKTESEVLKTSLAILQTKLRKDFKEAWKAPFTGRIRTIAPFFPFSPNEQAVVSHKFLLELFDDVRRDIDLHPDVKRYIGHVHLSVQKATKICQHLSEENYDKDLGARSYFSSMEDLKTKLCDVYTDVEEVVTEDINGGPLRKLTMRLNSDSSGDKSVVIIDNGWTAYKRSVVPNGCTASSEEEKVVEEDEEDTEL
ncbi:P-loop containing nucleoside triphosphate hydrolase protein [Phyllosticta capitalensis]|uniref:P-loop containing nucleoside triphosphate hydrolase protein n=1 Tax=Phyllosticta capitalensis TaxID=121624 RepID=UPI00312ECE9E